MPVHDAADRRAEPEDAEHLQGRPASKYHIEDVARAGGIHTILGEVARGRPGLLDLSCMTVTGKTLGENIADYDVRAADAAIGREPADPRPPGRRADDQAWTVPSVAAESRSQAAGLAVLDSEGEELARRCVGGTAASRRRPATASTPST